jgi:GT2 family glycosyltransferase
MNAPRPAEGPRVTVIIPSWNGRELLATVSLPSLAQQTYRDFTTLVVDNGSTDGSQEYIRADWPDVSVLALSRNHGFAAAVNRGIEAAASPLVALVNNDMELHPEWLEALTRAIDDRPAAGSVAGKIMWFDKRAVVWSVGEGLDASGRVFSQGYGARDDGQYEKARPILSACAGAALYRRDTFDAVGGFDEDFFAYHEDADWGFRAQVLGYECWFIPTAVAYHVAHATSSQMSADRAAWVARNACWFLVKNLPASVAIHNLGPIVRHVGGRFRRTASEGSRRLALGAALQTIRLTPRMLRKRRATYSQRRVTVDYLNELITPIR